MSERWKNVVGWLAVALSLAAGCTAACWGIGRAFFEGWWEPSLLNNVGMTAAWLIPAAIIVVFGLTAIRWPRVGGALHILLGAAILVLLHLALSDGGYLNDPNDPPLSPEQIVCIAALILAIIGTTYILGRPRPRWLALALVTLLPVATAMICSVEPIWRISHRRDDGITTARRVQGNGVDLVWAPAGPGWPKQGGQTLEEAEQTVSRLTDDGLSLADSPRNIWRLPTIDEAVRSLTRDGQNAGGTWDPASGKAVYRISPDKESPLWHVHSPVVDWWTSSRDPNWPDRGVAYIVSYRGKVSKQRVVFFSAERLGFRAVKSR
jgi:hypothetical protein